MTTHTIPRTGSRPLRFEGEQIYEDSTREEEGIASQRWWEVEVFRLTDGRYVVARHYRTRWLSERPVDEAEVVETAEEAIAALEDHDPMDPVLGFPPGERFEHRQAHLHYVITTAWRALVSRAAEALEVAETI